MSGEELKNFLKGEGINLSLLSRQLGLNSSQALNIRLRAKELKLYFVNQVAEAIGRDLDYITGKIQNVTADGGSVAVAGDNNSVVTISERFIALLEKKDEQIDKLLDILSKK